MDGVALNLHSFYTAIESVFDDIARTVNVALPEGANWHQELQVQMAADLAGSRPPVIRRTTRDCLDEYRAFRHHLVRNVYTFTCAQKGYQIWWMGCVSVLRMYVMTLKNLPDSSRHRKNRLDVTMGGVFSRSLTG
jgi:hypothetical protein